LSIATQLIERQTGQYDPADFEDRYEARMRELIDAKLKGEGFDAEEEDKPDRGNVIDLMGALRRSLGQSEDAAPAPKKAAAPAAKATPKRGKKELTPDEKRRQSAFKLPIDGGKKGEQREEKAPARAATEKRAAPSGRVTSRKSA
jgi:hypothetical protein